MANANITILGRLGADPETRETKAGPVVKLRVAVTQGWGEKKTTGWYGVAIFGKRGDFVQQFCQKGDEVMVSGSLEQNEVEKGGEKRTYMEINASSVEKVGPRRDGAAPARASAPRQSQDDVPFAHRTVTPRDTDHPRPREPWSKASRA